MQCRETLTYFLFHENFTYFFHILFEKTTKATTKLRDKNAKYISGS